MNKKNNINIYETLYNSKLEDIERNLKKFIKAKELDLEPKKFREK